MGDKKDELTFDFSKLTKSFKKEDKETHHHEEAGKKEASEELSIDVKSVGDFVKKHKVLFLVLIPLLFSFFLRIQPLYLPITDQWAESTVENYYKSQITQQINTQYPNLPPANKERLANEQLQNLIGQQGPQYQQQMSQLSAQYKEHYRDETGQTYIGDIDSYQWFRYAGDIVEHGYIGDEKRDGVQYDTHMLAPKGKRVGNSFYPIFGAYFYKIMHAIRPSTTLVWIFFIIPAIISALSVVPAFFIARKIAGNTGGIFAALLVAVNPNIISRTAAGSADTDAWNIFFPLLIFWLILEAYEAKTEKNMLILSAVTGFAIGLFAFTWEGWWYIFDFLVATIVIYGLYYVYMNRKNIAGVMKKPHFVKLCKMLGVFFVTSALFVILFTNFNTFLATFRDPVSFIILKEAAKQTLWPNVYTTVAELNPANTSQIIASVGGIIMAIGLIGILATVFRKDEERKGMIYAILLIIWFFGTFYASFKGVRFILLMVPAVAVAFGIGIGRINEFVGSWMKKEMDVSRWITALVVIIFACVLLFSPARTAYATTQSMTPSFNDAWAGAMYKIRDNSQENAIINSWWDFGHWFKAYSDRAVTFDGASQNTPQAHWIGKVLLTSDEKEAVGILRMLDCSGNDAFDVLKNKTNDTLKSVEVLYKVVVSDKEKARKIMAEYTDEDTAEKALQFTHCNPPENFFITSEDMVGKSGVWAHFGSWDFRRAKVWIDLKSLPMQEAKKVMVDELGYTEEEAEKLYFDVQRITDERDANNWISPWPSVVGAGSCAADKDDKDKVICVYNAGGQRIPISINLKTLSADIAATDGVKHPNSISYAVNGKYGIREFKEDNIGYSITLYVSNDTIETAMMAPVLAESMFTRMFYLQGVGLKNFKSFDHQRDLGGLDIYTWKVEWPE